MDFINVFLENIYTYSEQHSTVAPEYLAALERETHLKTLAPRMVSGNMQGRILSFLSKLIAPKRILEIGTFTGYSALCLAEGLQTGGQLDTIEVNEEMSFLIEKYVKIAEMENKIKIHYGNAMNLVPQFDAIFDLVFIDADKKNYSNYFDLCLPKVRSGGLIIADNVLWSGKVAQPAADHDRETKNLDTFNKKLLDCPEIEVLLLPIRDGLAICRKK
ncbi:MAG: hypothetical protein RL757_3153 [Bacteroidota bacterium]|jgi:predicted O-methyltransferase YrrM